MTSTTTKFRRAAAVCAAALCTVLLVTSARAAPAAPVEIAQADAAKTVKIDIRKRKVVSGNVLRVSQGDKLRLEWSTDEPVELHLHGYDIEAKAAPGKPAVMSFTARASGRFPVEAHGFGGGHGGHGESTLLYLEVLPK